MITTATSVPTVTPWMWQAKWHYVIGSVSGRKNTLRPAPPPFQHHARLWWELASRVERRHFMMTQVPKSLYARFKGMEWSSLEAFKSSFWGALRFRRKVLNKLVGETANFVRDTPCHGPYLPRRPPLSRNKWGGPFGLFSTTSKATTFVEPT